MTTNLTQRMAKLPKVIFLAIQDLSGEKLSQKGVEHTDVLTSALVSRVSNRRTTLLFTTAHAGGVATAGMVQEIVPVKVRHSPCDATGLIYHVCQVAERKGGDVDVIAIASHDTVAEVASWRGVHFSRDMSLLEISGENTGMF